ncbi:MAG: AraC family transcriptional regulator ligand-binding domain-containing protein [Mycobacteriaceae bacterium]
MDYPLTSACLIGFADLVQSFGADPKKLCQKFAIPLSALEDTSISISTRAVAHLLEYCGTAFQCPDFGLQMASRQGKENLGPLGMLLDNCPTYGAALLTAAEYSTKDDFSLIVDVLVDPPELLAPYDPDIAEIHFRSRSYAITDFVQTVDHGLAYIHHCATLMAGSNYIPESAHLPHKPLGDPQIYRDFFGVDVFFEQPVAALRIRRKYEKTPINNSDPLLHRLLSDHLRNSHSFASQSLSAQVYSFVESSLADGAATISSTAKKFDMHPRTLQRQLYSEGSEFREIIDAVRRSKAEYLLRNTHLPLTAVARKVGLSEQSTLTRCCKRWFSKTPSDIRLETNYINKMSKNYHLN